MFAWLFCCHLKRGRARQPCSVRLLAKFCPTLRKSQPKQALCWKLLGPEQADIYPKPGDTGQSQCSSDPRTACSSHSYVFQVLSKWSDIKLVKHLYLAEVTPVIAVCPQFFWAQAFSAVGQILPLPTCSLCKARLLHLLPKGAVGEQQLLTRKRGHSTLVFRFG